ncbi:replication initiator protein [Sigmofec virus UA08Rod_3874]|uniref:Replication initiator protein n=1 Tax=Sigmofec virus UA08Rod_3874 TaxID=2929391 RepID=A0A976R837_9VIRU|nr:replication initiator protein [Sigmofec virus UA08Rod_3874]
MQVTTTFVTAVRLKTSKFDNLLCFNAKKILYLHMCLNPIHLNISSRTKYYYKGYASLVNTEVPCCMCDECVSISQTDNFIRIASEYEECIKNGGKCAFVTFTFDNDNVPFYSYSYNSRTKTIDFEKIPYDSNNDSAIYGFDKSNVQRFFNSLRKYYERKGVVNGIRYFVVPEYGTDKKYTQRPHYHGLIMFSKEVIKLYRNGIQTKILKDIQKFWTVGYISKSKKYPLFVESLNAVSYVTKYVQKTINLNKLRRFNKFFDFVKENKHCLNPFDYIYNKENQNEYSLFKFYLKKNGSHLFTMKSKNFGMYAVRSIQNKLQAGKIWSAYEEFRRGYQYVMNSKKMNSTYSNYYRRKLFYDIRSDGSYILNYYGFRIMQYEIKDSLKITRFKIHQLNPNIDLPEIKNRKDEMFVFKRYYKDNTFLNQYIIYKKLVRGCVFTPHVKSVICKYLNSSSCDVTKLIPYLVKAKYGYIFDSDSMLCVNEDSMPLSLYLKKNLYSNPVYIPIFEKFDYICTRLIINGKNKEYEKRKKEFEQRKMLKDLLT